MNGRLRSLLPLLAGVLLAATPALALAPPETVCIQCHGGQAGPLGDPAREWPGSVHQRNGISCHDCHGGDPADYANAMSPARGFIGVPAHDRVPEFCGRCHVGVLEDYRQSAHGRKVSEGGAQCVVCHGSHAVREASLDLINERDCSRCHDYGRAAEIRAALDETDARLAGLGEGFERLRRLGADVEPAKGKLFDLRNRFHRVFHSVEVDKVRAETGRVQAEAALLQAEIDAYDRQTARRRVWGGVAVGLLVMLGLVLLQVRHTYADEERRG
ncbi:MAG: cytochrome C [Deltaproteobacteria bacterium]|nr:MAG: cytochrome C [Deltaproteobacteria bacterium]